VIVTFVLLVGLVKFVGLFKLILLISKTGIRRLTIGIAHQEILPLTANLRPNASFPHDA